MGHIVWQPLNPSPPTSKEKEETFTKEFRILPETVICPMGAILDITVA